MKIVVLLLLMFGSNSILPIERQIVDSPVECAIGWTAKGEVAFNYCGSEELQVFVPERLRWAIIGGVFSHNHPPKVCWTFSEQDLRIGADLYLREIRAVSLRNERLRVVVARNLKSFFGVTHEAIDMEVQAQRLMSTSNDGCAGLDATWRILAEQYGFEYVVWEE